MKYDYVIVGAGLYGAVFAQRATEKGKKCLVIDRRGHIGGNTYSEKIEGITVHKYGPHIFHTDKEDVWEYVNKFARFNHFIYCPIANFKGDLYNLPFNMNTFTKMWPDVRTPEQAQKRIAEQVMKAKIINPKNLEEHAISLVGNDIYIKLIKGYTEKQWGRPCSELPAFIIKRLPVRMTFDNNYFDHPYQGIPIDGYTPMVERMLMGVDVQLNIDFLKLKNELINVAKKIVYTGSIDEYFGYCFGELKYRSLRFETDVLNQSNYQGTAGMNYTDIDSPYTRIIEHKHFMPGEGSFDKTVITKEYPVGWKRGDEPYYPINDKVNEELYRRYEALAKKEKKVSFRGRLGSYRYMNMDQVIKQAMEDTK